jgi:hypothetical protein
MFTRCGSKLWLLLLATMAMLQNESTTRTQRAALQRQGTPARHALHAHEALHEAAISQAFGKVLQTRDCDGATHAVGMSYPCIPG